jgi:nucleotide-binding universal stress UspA family protein
MSAPNHSVVAGAGRVDEPDPAVAAAATLARRLGATLHVVHAYDLPSPIQEAYARELFLDRHLLDRYGDDLAARLEAMVRAHEPDVDVVCHAVEGSAGECVVEVAREVGAALIVVGASRGGRFWQQFLGTTAEAVVRSSAAPVMVIRRPFARPAERVLLTTDLSAGSSDVLRRGAGLLDAIAPGARRRCLLAVQLDTMPFDFRRELVERLAERQLAAFLADAAPFDPPAEERVRLGTPADEILAEAQAWEADLLVVGSHGRRGVARFLLGSVAGATLRGTTCNVLVVPVVAPVVVASASGRERTQAAVAI